MAATTCPGRNISRRVRLAVAPTPSHSLVNTRDTHTVSKAQTRQAQHAGDIRADTVLAGGGFHAAPRPSSRCVDPSPQLLKLRAVENDDIEIMAA
ncbi:unnamed protein product [Pieris brassicae]|uniref:Uncharacterized protein n=1 Tax=Pieris brassicae TaxID=7116 RepID=A0A9P0X1U4_PIEBR|nr:unnamed protein product [Pieris brassicae]